MPADWPTSVIPLRPGVFWCVGDQLATIHGPRRIVALICDPHDPLEQPWARTEGDPMPDPDTMRLRIAAIQARLDQIEAEVRDKPGLIGWVARRVVAGRWPFHPGGRADMWLDRRIAAGPGRIHRLAERIVARWKR